MKFKVGDKVRVINKRGDHWDQDGKMDKWMKQVVTIREIDSDGNINIEEDVFDRPPIGWIWDESDFEQEREGKRYLFFEFDNFYPLGGMKDCTFAANDIREIEDHIRGQSDCIQYYDTWTGQLHTIERAVLSV